MNIHQDYLGRVGERLGLPLSFDENSQCLLMLDENLFVSVRVSGDCWVLRGLLREMSPNSHSETWRDLLVMNRELAEQNGGTLGYEPESQALLYLCSLPHPGNVDDVIEGLERFISQQEKLQSLLQNY